MLSKNYWKKWSQNGPLSCSVGRKKSLRYKYEWIIRSNSFVTVFVACDIQFQYNFLSCIFYQELVSTANRRFKLLDKRNASVIFIKSFKLMIYINIIYLSRLKTFSIYEQLPEETLFCLNKIFCIVVRLLL